MKIIVGLGNPGLKYKNTRHNAGFMVLKVLAKRHHIALRTKGYGGVYGIGRIASHEVMLFEPLTYMNLSGEAVRSVSSAKLKDEQDLLVVGDDVSIPLGTLRLREKGSSGGHNGLKSIIGIIGQDFARLRFGVGSQDVPEDMAAYVLAPFLREEKRSLEETLDKAAECVESWVRHGVKDAMNRFN